MVCIRAGVRGYVLEPGYEGTIEYQHPGYVPGYEDIRGLRGTRILVTSYEGISVWGTRVLVSGVQGY